MNRHWKVVLWLPVMVYYMALVGPVCIPACGGILNGFPALIWILPCIDITHYQPGPSASESPRQFAEFAHVSVMITMSTGTGQPG